MKNTVIYHSGDFDGIFCREIAKRFLGPGNADAPNEYIGWNFGDPPVPIPPEGPVYVMDLPVDRTFAFDFAPIMANRPGAPSVGDFVKRLIWIDHHKSSIGSHPTSIPGYRIDGVAACRLAWQWFTANDFQRKHYATKLTDKEAFIERLVSEPIAVRLAGEYDVWDHRGDGDLQFQFGLRSIDLTPERWSKLLGLGQEAEDFTNDVVAAGLTSMVYSANVDADRMKASYVRHWEGLNFLCICGRGNSNTFDSRDVPETGHDALAMFFYNGKEWIVSLYHAKHRKDLDLSKIAVKHGGGGHAGACGFQTQTLPFL